MTGDAANYLWPLIMNEIKNDTYIVMQVPHHGSEENVFWEAYQALNIKNFIVSADKFKSWRHPSKNLGAAIRERKYHSHSRKLFCTNSHENCELKKTDFIQTFKDIFISAVSFYLDQIDSRNCLSCLVWQIFPYRVLPRWEEW